MYTVGEVNLRRDCENGRIILGESIVFIYLGEMLPPHEGKPSWGAALWVLGLLSQVYSEDEGIWDSSILESLIGCRHDYIWKIAD